MPPLPGVFLLLPKRQGQLRLGKIGMERQKMGGMKGEREGGMEGWTERLRFFQRYRYSDDVHLTQTETQTLHRDRDTNRVAQTQIQRPRFWVGWGRPRAGEKMCCESRAGLSAP